MFQAYSIFFPQVLLDDPKLVLYCLHWFEDIEKKILNVNQNNKSVLILYDNIYPFTSYDS